MAKHAVPKKKTSKARTKRRYGSFKTTVLRKLTNAVNLVTCPECGAKALSHTVCKQCGKYRGRQVLNMDKKVSKVTKIKA